MSKVLAARRDLHQQRIVKRRDDRAGVAHAAVEPNAETARRAIGQNLAVIGHEFVFRIFGRDAALHGETVARNVVLLRANRFPARAARGLARSDLRAHQIDAGDDFGDRVLDLDARVHLDEEPFVRVEIVEKFDRAGVVVADFLAPCARRRRKVPCAPFRRGRTDGAISTTF